MYEKKAKFAKMKKYKITQCKMCDTYVETKI